MKYHPILFSAPMVRAILAGTKTQTRRVLKPQPTHFNPVGVPRRVIPSGGPSDVINCHYGQPGDQLWVRETFFAFGRWETRFNAKKGRDEWHFIDMTLEAGHQYAYPADGHQIAQHRRTAGAIPIWWKRPAIHMPRRASRITLQITGVRVERLQDMSEADCIAEGIESLTYSGITTYRNYALTDEWAAVSPMLQSPIASYRSLWESINGAGSWGANPWVWVIEFRKLEGGAA